VGSRNHEPERFDYLSIGKRKKPRTPFTKGGEEKILERSRESLQ